MCEWKTKMSRLVVITVAILAIAEAGYQYNTPSVSFVVPSKPGTSQAGQVPRNVAPINSGSINNGFSQPSLLLGADPKYSSAPILRPVANSNLNTGYAQTPSASSVTHLNAYANPFVPPVSNNLYRNSLLSVSANFNSGYPHNPAPLGIVDLNDGNDQTVIPAPSSNLLSHNAGSNIGYSKPSIPLPNANLNNGYTQNLIHPSFGPGYVQPLIRSVSGSFNTGYSQSPSTVLPLNNDLHAQKWIPLTAGNVNSGYSQILSSPNTFSLNNGYAQNLRQSPSKISPNSDYSHSLASSGTAGVSNGYTQEWVPSATSNPNTGSLNTGYSNNVISSGASYTQGYSQTLIPPVTGNLNTGYSQSLIPSGTGNADGHNQLSPVHVTTHINNSFAQDFSSTASGTLNDQTSTSSFNNNLDAGYVQDFVSQLSSPFSDTAHDVQTIGLNTGANGYSSPADVSNEVPVQSKIYKHVYFHVPPPEDEQQTIRPVIRQKNYKILFIKVPSQERYSQQIAQLRNNAAAAVEHKTLIYVLVKKPEAEQLVVTTQKPPSDHEVFFVKYNGDPLDLAAQVNGELDKSGSVESIVPLEPGLVNGHK